MTRDELLAPLIANGADVAVFADWELVPGIVDGVHVCTAALSGPEIHFAIVPQHQKRLIRRANTRAFLAPLLARHGYLTTRVLLPRTEQQRFVQRLGFTPTWSDGRCQYYLMTALPFERTSR